MTKKQIANLPPAIRKALEAQLKSAPPPPTVPAPAPRGPGYVKAPAKPLRASPKAPPAPAPVAGREPAPSINNAIPLGKGWGRRSFNCRKCGAKTFLNATPQGVLSVIHAKLDYCPKHQHLCER